LETIKARMTVEAGEYDAKFNGAVDAAEQIYLNEGAYGFFKGIQANLLYVPMALTPFLLSALGFDFEEALALEAAKHEPTTEIISTEGGNRK
jgi:hypothetical protein